MIKKASGPSKCLLPGPERAKQWALTCCSRIPGVQAAVQSIFTPSTLTSDHIQLCCCGAAAPEGPGAAACRGAQERV